MISSNSTKPTDQQVDAFIAANPHASDDDIRKYMNGEMPDRPERFHVMDALAAPFMGFAKGASYGVTGRVNPDYQKGVSQDHPLLYGAGEIGGMLAGGGAEIKGLGVLGKAAAKVLPKAAEVVRGVGAGGKAARLAGRTAHAVASGAAMAAGEGGDVKTGAGVGGMFSLGAEGAMGLGGVVVSPLVKKLMGRDDYLDMVRVVLNKKNEDAVDLLGSLKGLRAAAAEQAYEKALAGKFTTDPAVLGIFKEPEIRKAYEELVSIQQGRARQGLKYTLMPSMDMIDIAMQAAPGTKAATIIGQGIPLEAIHTLSRELRGNVGKAVDQSDKVLKSAQAKKILETLDKAEDHIGKMVPEYAAADKMYASDSRAIHALAAGRGSINPSDAANLKNVKRYAGDIPVFKDNSAKEIAVWVKNTRAKAEAGDVDAARDLEHYAIGAYSYLKQEAEDGKKILTSPSTRNKIAALAGNDPDAAIRFYKAVTSKKEMAADLAATAVWAGAHHPIMAAHSASRAVGKGMREDAPDVFVKYLMEGSNDPQSIMDKLELLQKAELYHPRRRATSLVAAKAGGLSAN